MSFPAIESERIALRELTESDAMALYEVYSDEQAMRYWDSARHADASITLATVRGLIESWYIPQGVSWGVVLKDSQELIGQFSLHSWNIETMEAQVGYIIHPRYWGKGYGSQALKIAVDFGFSQLRLKTIIAEIDPRNISSAVILEKNGFSVFGCRKNDLIVNGISCDTHVYRRFNSHA